LKHLTIFITPMLHASIVKSRYEIPIGRLTPQDRRENRGLRLRENYRQRDSIRFLLATERREIATVTRANLAVAIGFVAFIVPAPFLTA
jgi:hypothetical protein